MINTNSINRVNQKLDAISRKTEISYIAAVFNNVEDAKHAYKKLNKAQREGLINVVDAGYVEKTETSWLDVHDHSDWERGQNMLGGGIAGGITAGLIGLVAGAILVPASIGFLVGGAIMSVYDQDVKFSQRDLLNIADTLPVGTAALVAIVEDDYLKIAEYEIQKHGASSVHSNKIPIAPQLH
jgi:uncharacterized membrane protein